VAANDTPVQSSGILRSALLTAAGVAHGFSTRVGGVSVGPYASMNLGWSVGDDPRAVEENHQRLAAAVGHERTALRLATQAHGPAVLDTDATSRDRRSEPPGTGHDALVARRQGVAVGVRTADCVPVLVANPATGAVAAIHAGWRGVVAGVVPAALEVLAPDASARGGLVAAIGPHIRVDRFEVGADVAKQIADASDASVIVPREPRPHVDLARAIRIQLERAGLDAKNIDDVGGCTLAEPERFHSHRRDGEKSGRMLSVIVAGAPT
jgi:YfiH family protein